MNDSSQIDYFYDLSVVLTGYNLVTLYGTGNGDLFFNSLKDVLGDDLVKSLLTEFELIVEASENYSEKDFSFAVEDKLLQNEKWGPVCRNIIKMWFMGNWYAMPEDWRENYVNSTEDFTKVLSSEAYIEGLVWKAMGRHPKSAKQPGYGTWALSPDF